KVADHRGQHETPVTEGIANVQQRHLHEGGIKQHSQYRPQQGFQIRPNAGPGAAQRQPASDRGKIDPDLPPFKYQAIHQPRTRETSNVPASMNPAARVKANSGETAVQTRPTVALEINLATPLTVPSAPMLIVIVSACTMFAVTVDSSASCTATYKP